MRKAAFDYLLEADRPDPVVTQYLHERPAAAGTEQEATDQNDKARIEGREAADFWQYVLRDRVGRREVFKLLRMVSAFESSPFQSSPAGFPDQNATWFRAGQIEQGRAVYQMLAIVARPELFAMQDEFNVYGALAVRPDREVHG